MLKLNGLSAPLDYTEDSLRLLIARKLKMAPENLLSFRVSRRSVDARDKRDVHFVLSLELALRDERAALRRHK